MSTKKKQNANQSSPKTVKNGKQDAKKNHTNSEKQPEKVLTKYDKKVLARKKQQEKEKREKQIFKGCLVVVALAIIAGIAAYFVADYRNEHATYIKVGDYEISRTEYDYYYNTAITNFESNYSQYLSYFGLDTSKDLSEQQYSDDLSWADYFAQTAAETIQQTKALKDDAANAGFSYDVTEDYNSYIDGIKQSASQESMSEKKYYKTKFGQYATESKLKSTIEEYLLVSKYYEQLTTDNTPDASEISAYYEQNKDQYDSIDYRMMTFDDENTANEMLAKITDEESFKNLCITYASDDDKDKYTSEDASLTTGAASSSLSSANSTWLLDAARTAGDKTVVEDSANSKYNVLYFVNRYYDDSNDSKISSTISQNKVSEYIENLIAGYTITDDNGHLKYLTVETEAAE